MENLFLGGNKSVNPETLPSVIKEQYELNPGEDHTVSIEGNTEIVEYPLFTGVLLKAAQIIGVDLPYKGQNLKTELIRTSRIDDLEHTFWERIFHYPNGKSVVLKSKFQATETGVVERFKYGLSFEMDIKQTEDGLQFMGKHLYINLFGLNLPIPQIFTLGKLIVTQTAIDHETYDFSFEFNHPIFWKTYAFRGVYKLVSEI